MDAQQQKRQKLPWKRLLIIVIVFLLIVAGAILWVDESQGPWLNIVPVLLFTVLGVIIALFQWLFPVSSDTPAHPPVPAHPLPHVLPVGVSPAQLVVQLPSPITQPLAEQGPSAKKITYRSIFAVSPPTDPRTIQQREGAVKEVYAQLTRDDITAIVLTGIGGVGKSTLAALVYRYAEEQRRNGKGPFSGRALWLKIDSAAVTMSDLICTIFDALGKPLPDLSSLAPHNQAMVLFNVLNDTDAPRLIVLDQFENLLDWQTGHALPDRPGVGEWLDAINSQPCRCRVLLTSRPWPQGTRSYPPTFMQEYQVRGLAVAEGIELLQKMHVEATESELRMAVERCSGHAFALTLLASLLRNRSLSLSAFFKDPHHAQLWTGNVARNLLDHIYALQLDPVQRQLLLAFSVYREPIPLEAARAVVDNGLAIAHANLHQALDALLMQHLLEPSGGGRYQLHAIVTGFAHEHFAAHDEEANRRALLAAHARAAEYYLQYAAQHCPPGNQRHGLSDVQPFLEAIWQYCQAEQWQAAYDLITRENIYNDLCRWGNYALVLELYQDLLPLEHWQPQPASAARICDELSNIYRLLGQMELARQYCEEALRICKEVGDRREEAWALSNIGRVYADLGDKRAALGYYEEALKKHREIGNLGGESSDLTNIGWVYYDFGRMDLAREYYEQALRIRREVKDHRGEGAALNSLGRVYANLGQLDTARDYHQQALLISREVGDRGGEGWTLNNLGRVYSFLGQKEQALAYYEQALAIRREIGDRRGEGSTLSNLGLFYASIGEHERAMQCYEQSLRLRREVGHRNGEGKTLNNMGLLLMDLGQYEQAIPYFKEALFIRRELAQTKREGKTLHNLGLCYVELRRYDVALACLLQAKELLQTVLDTTLHAEQSYEATLQALAALRGSLGEEQFSWLTEQVEAQKERLIESAVRTTSDTW